MIWMGYERGVAATSLFSHLVLHQLFPGKLLESARWQHAEKKKRFGSCYLPNSNLVGECWFDPPWRVDSIPVLACTCFPFPRYDFTFWFLKKLRLFFGSSQSCGHGGHVMGEPPAAEIETRGSSQGSDQGMGEIGPKRVQVVEFFLVGMRVAGDHEIYGDLSDVPPQRLREDMGLVVCKSFSRFLYWYFFELLLVAGESCHQEHSRLVAEGQQCPKSLCDT